MQKQKQQQNNKINPEKEKEIKTLPVGVGFLIGVAAHIFATNFSITFLSPNLERALNTW